MAVMLNLSLKQQQIQRDAIHKAVTKAGKKRDLANLLSQATGEKVSRGTIHDFIRRGLKPEWALQIHNVTGVALHELHPVAYNKKYVRPCP